MTAATQQLPKRGAGADFMRSRWFPPAVIVAVFLVVWTIIHGTVETLLLPTVGEVGVFMWNELRGETIAKYSVYESFALSLLRLGIGLLATMALGIVIGVAMGRSRRIAAMLDDFVVALLNMPFLIWALLWPLWIGFTFWTPIFTVILAAVPFVITNVAAGVRNVPNELLAMSRSYGVSQNRVVRHVILPSLAPFLFAGFRYALSLGWKALVLAELFGSDRGVGWMLKYWYDAHRITALIGYALFFVVFAIIIDRIIVTGIANRVFRWQPKRARGKSAV